MDRSEVVYFTKRAECLNKLAEQAARKEGMVFGGFFGAVMLAPDHISVPLLLKNINASMTLGAMGITTAFWLARRYSFNSKMDQLLYYYLPLSQANNSSHHEFRVAAEQQCRTMYAATVQGVVALGISCFSIAKIAMGHAGEDTGLLPFTLSLITLAGAIYHSRQSRKHGASLTQLSVAPTLG